MVFLQLARLMSGSMERKWDKFSFSRKHVLKRSAFSYVGTQIALKTTMAKLSSLISWQGDG